MTQIQNNSRPISLYNNLLNLASKNAGFGYKDFPVAHCEEKTQLRIFSYRLVKKEDFNLPDAKECRGHTFWVDANGELIDIVTMPLPKFFNLNEVPETRDIDPHRIKHIMEKLDGSLVSISYFDGELLIKTQRSLDNEQVMATKEYIRSNNFLYEDLLVLTSEGYTVNCEWTAPDNRIVINYPTSELTILNIRNNYSGESIDREEVSDLPEIYDRWVRYKKDVSDISSFVESVPDMEDIEGFVYVLDDGMMVKHRTNWYLDRHRLLDGLQSKKTIMENVINGKIDDIKAYFYDDKNKLAIIEKVESRVVHNFNRTIKAVEGFYKENHTLDRKDYAIKAKDLNDGLLGLYMNRYLGREIDYEKYALDNHRKFLSKIDLEYYDKSA